MHHLPRETVAKEFSRFPQSEKTSDILNPSECQKDQKNRILATCLGADGVTGMMEPAGAAR